MMEMEMSDPDLRQKRSNKFTRNKYAKALRDQGDFKGAFSLKIVDSRKQEYKRSKVRINNIDDEE